MPNIHEFQGEHRWLSNFWPCNVVFDGLVYPTVEHAYQAAKTNDPRIRDYIARLPTPGQAKKFGRTIDISPGWRERRINVMSELIHYKFSDANPELMDKLINTGTCHIEEGNTWGDRFWGVCGGKGQNRLGAIIMHKRYEITTDRRARVARAQA